MDTARKLYQRLNPAGPLDDEKVMKTTISLSFNILDHATLDDEGDEAISLVESGPRKSFVDLLERAEQ